MNDWQVGQQVIVSDTQRRIHEGVITKVAQKYIYVQWDRFGSPDRFNMVTGRCAEPRLNFGYGCQVYTRAEHDRSRRTEEVVKALREAGIDLNHRGTFDLDQLEAILAGVQRD